MNIMHVIDSLTVGGAERMLVDIANSTSTEGHQVSVCATRHRGDLAAGLQPEIKFWELKRKRRFDWRALRLFAALAHDSETDVFHAHGRSTFAFLAFSKALGLIDCPIVVHDHEYVDSDSTVPYWFRWASARWASHYVGVYSKLESWANDAGIPRDKVTIIQNALDLDRIRAAAVGGIREEFDIPDDIAIGIVVGGQLYVKGTDLLINAFAQSSHRDRARLFIVGDTNDSAYLRDCCALRDSLGLTESITFLGKRLDVASLLKSVDFAVLSSRSESGPLVLIEYMACGLPFVSTNVGGVANLVADLGVPGFVPPNDSLALASALDELLELSPLERSQRGKIGEDIAEQYFNICGRLPEWFRVYASAMGGRKQ
jgi:glycosyltransferase involved in cell wall biosynthesis